ncbi:hybrid sensor histidine kinase/response regulator [Pseudoxanthomonas daejeonensis]|nr:hybrid sensor histidine kinase/response regulator [Pseudoxanthomonas daejeonensis]
MAAPAQRRVWPVLTAMAGACTLLAVGLVLSGNATPSWWTVAAGLALLTVAFALGSLFSSGAQARDLNEAHARAAAAEDECTLLQRDVNRHDQLEQQLLQAKRAAESAALAKGEFLATMSHEIRTPLNGIIPMLDLVARGNLAPDQREMLRTAHESSLQLLRIVDDILDYSKLEANRLELEITSFNLRELLEAVLQLMQRPAESKGLRLELQIDPNVRLPVRGDPVRMRQVLTNLIGNAVKFTERGGIQLTVRRLGETAAQHMLRFEVRDTGIGIGHAQQARLFSAFTQADASTTRLYGGTGLGLAICKRIVDLMGGRIGVQSEPGQGSTFWFEAPLLKVIGDVQIRQTAHDARRVLAITPNLRLRQRIALLLPNWGMTVSIVETTQEALERLRQQTAPGQSANFVAVIADYDGLRHSARALHRALLRTPAYADVKLLWLYGEEEIPEELREGTGLLPRLAPDADLRGALLEPQPVAESPKELFGAPTPAAPDPAALEPSHPAPPARLLLVEDNPVNLLVAQKLLSVLGYECDTAPNGEVALSHMASGSYDLVLMDCQMPVLDGYSATRRWREHEAGQAPGKRLPIVAMTANAMAGDRQRCLDAGMDDYLSKPVARDQLDTCLRRWLRMAPARSATRASTAVTGAPSAAEPVVETPSAPVPSPSPAPAKAVAPPSAPATPPVPATPVVGAVATLPTPPPAATREKPAVAMTPDMPIFVPAAGRPPETSEVRMEEAPSAQAPPPPVLEPEMLDELREIAGDEAISIVNLFLEDAPRLVRLMEQASAMPDLEVMREAAHALKSSAANVGALALSAAAKRIELGARAHALERPAVAVALLIAEYARARVALQGWLSTTASTTQSSSLLSR